MLTFEGVCLGIVIGVFVGAVLSYLDKDRK